MKQYAISNKHKQYVNKNLKKEKRKQDPIKKYAMDIEDSWQDNKNKQINKITKKIHDCFQEKFYLQKQAVSWIWPMAHCLPTFEFVD